MIAGLAIAPVPGLAAGRMMTGAIKGLVIRIFGVGRARTLRKPLA
jgi:hypothetical protein